MSDTQQEQSNQQSDGSKEEKKFNDNWKKLSILFKGDPTKVKKLSKDGMADIVDALLAEKRIALIADFKVRANKVIEAKVDFNKLEKTLRQELENKLNQKRKEINAEMVAVIGMVEGFEELVKDYKGVISTTADELQEEKLETETPETPEP